MRPIVLTLLAGCVDEADLAGEDEPVTEAPPDWIEAGEPVACDGGPSAPSYVDVARDWGLGGIHDPDYAHAGGAGAGLSDLDLDGDLDFVLAYWNTDAQVFWRDGDAFLPGPTLGAGQGGMPQGVGLVDHDADGDWDVAVNASDNRAAFWRNDGGSFTEATELVYPEGTGLAWDPPAPADWDLDGDVDLYLPALSVQSTARADRLLRNDGTGRMEDVTAAFLPETQGSRTFQAFWFDMDGDMYPEAYGINDQGWTMGGNVLFHNDGGQGFTSLVDTCFCATPVAGMSGDAADVDGDGLMDVYSGNSDASNLYLNAGDGTFVDAAVTAGATESLAPGDLDMVWGSLFLDHDNDGDVDILAVHGDLYSEFDPNEPLDLADSLLSQQEDGTFVDVAADYGIDALDSGRSIIVEDLNGDGVLDMLVTVITDWPHLWMSDGCTEAGWLEIEVAGVGLNPHGVGARVEIEAGGRRQVAYNWPQSGLNATREPSVHFGLGDAQTVDWMRVTLPTGETKETTAPFSARRRVVARFDE
ncbi:MAG: CRTAC1 family protein [Myxococcota bacterium]